MSVNVLDIRDLKIFIYAVENSSLTVTSEKLGIDQSTVTKRINSIEQKLKGKLFNRKSRPLQLTHFGEKVYFKGRHILEQMEQLENFHQQKTESFLEKVKIGLPITLVDDLYEYIDDRYKYDHYSTEVEMQSGWGRSLIQQVDERELALAIVMIPSNLQLSEHLFFKNIGTLPLVIVALKNGVKEYKTLERCSKKGWVVHPEGCCFRESLNKKLNEKGSIFYANKEVFGIEAQLTSIVNGEGLGIFPKPFFDKYSATNSDLEAVLVNDFDIHLKVGIVYADQKNSDQVNYFAKIIKERYFIQFAIILNLGLYLLDGLAVASI
ncbi:LysR family transcriptional regulator [Acinetobacter sp. ANC 3882]|uniref:LysR family transcriptional regulator n=1 Tax=Acinetobacter sp. ANC 3882 TaxID=2923423 RepID=UPI001F4B5204|nr:LysR family transcriptional regulator [Acinetobacter sp. ANC 3882]MCH7314404.1 LysR family transcriptional regulator [Acinetobacter sp. ANC 3882]